MATGSLRQNDGNEAFWFILARAGLEENPIKRIVLLTTVLLLAAACSRPAPDPGPRLNAAPIALEAVSAAAADGSYLMEPATGKLWRLSESPFIRVSWSQDGGTMLVNHEPLHNRYEANVIDLRTLKGTRLSGPGGVSLGGAVLSPHGEQLAFLNAQDGLQVANRDGTGWRNLNIPGSSGDIFWAPDSTRLAVASGGGEVAPVRVVEVASGGTTLAGEVRWSRFAWAPDSKRLALLHAESVTIRHLDTDATEEVPWITGEALWSPDGAYLASNVENYGPNAIGSTLMAMQTETGEPPRVLADTLRFVDWAPDSRQIAYISNGCAWKEYDLYSVRVDTGEKLRLTQSPEIAKHGPKWSPKGDVIAYTTRQGVMLAEVASGQERLLAALSAEPRLLGWSPDGRYLAFGLYQFGAMGCKEE